MVAEWKEFLWDVPEERIALWSHCHTLFIRYSFPSLQVCLVSSTVSVQLRYMLYYFILEVYLHCNDFRLGYFFLNMLKQWRKIFLQGSFMNFYYFLCNGLVG